MLIIGEKKCDLYSETYGTKLFWHQTQTVITLEFSLLHVPKVQNTQTLGKAV